MGHRKTIRADCSIRALLLFAPLALTSCQIAAAPEGGIRTEPLIARADADPGAEDSQATETPGSGPRIEPGERATIAILTPLGDPRESVRRLSRALVNSARLAAGDIASDGLTLRAYDTRGTADGARLAAEQAISDDVALILGPLFSGSVASVREVARRANINIIGFSTDTEAAGDNAFLTGFMPENEVRRIISYAASQGLARLALLVPATRYGDVVIEAAHEAADENDASILQVGRYVRSSSGIESGTETFVTIHRSIPPAERPQAILIADGGEALKALAAYLEHFGISPRDVKFLGTGLWNAAKTLEERSLRLGWFPAPDPRVRAAFEARYVAVYKDDPRTIGFLGFDAMAIAAALYAEGQARDDPYPFSREALTAREGFRGLAGTIRFKPPGARRGGVNERNLAILEVGKDGFRTIAPAPEMFFDRLILDEDAAPDEDSAPDDAAGEGNISPDGESPPADQPADRL